jgi:hypothetical protein
VELRERLRAERERLEGQLKAVEAYEPLFRGRATHVKRQLRAAIEALRRVEG